MRSFSKVLLWSALSSQMACVYGPRNGDSYSGSTVGKSLPFAGYSTVAGAAIRIQVLRSPNLTGTSNADWLDLLSTPARASTRPTIFHPASGDPLYAWSATVIPVRAGAPGAPAWVEGGVVRMRVLQDNSVVRTFDDLNCPGVLASNYRPRDVWEICRSHTDGVLWLVDRDVPLPGGGQGVLPSSVTYLSRRATPGAGEAYYNTFNARGTDPTLDAWRANRGFPTNEVSARYYNAGDLGLGREMHCRNDGANLYCYVTNYGSATDGLADQTRALGDLASGTNPVATVAMDYRPADSSNRVRFYVYQGGTLQPQVELDGQGPKDVPGLCIACHGGTFDVATNRVTGAQFLPFDADSFAYSSAVPRDEEAFRRLNQMVRATSPNRSITQLIDGWYHGAVGTVGTPFDGQFVPNEWRPPCSPSQTCKRGYLCSSSTGSGVCLDDPAYPIKSDPSQIALYRKVFAPYCRTCHIAQTGITFERVADFVSLAPLAACNTKTMPHAELIYQKFRASGARGHLLGAAEALGNTGARMACE